MTTLAFRLDDEEARLLRLEAKRDQLTLSELLRQKLLATTRSSQPIGLATCPITGTTIFSSAPQFGTLSTASVNEILGDFQ